MKKENMFTLLVENAFDFLFKAITEIEEHPKYSIIHFHAAVELIIKARLMSEHWSLIISAKQEADWDKFISGDFQSVTLDEAAKRLNKIVRCGLSDHELRAFKSVAKHRNKMVHFFLVSQSEENNVYIINEIVKKQLQAWFYLHQLLIFKWEKEFSGWRKEIDELDSSLRRIHEFLKVVFESKNQEIEEKIKLGRLFSVCPSCDFEAQEGDCKEKSIYEAHCLVCGLNEVCLNVRCPDCDEMIVLKGDGFGRCGHCDRRVEPEDVASMLVDGGRAHIAAMEGDYSWGEANCGRCDGYHTVVRTENDEWICASCLEKFEDIGSCGWCNDLNTGDMEYSYANGCNHCEGLSGWHRDD